MPGFYPGQCWLSDAESELGLCFVSETNLRQVTMHFPATGVTRIYAKENAPLSRVELPPGEQVALEDGAVVTIQSIDQENGFITYQCQYDNGEHLALPENQLNPLIQLNRPKEKLFAGRLDKDHWFALRYQSRLQLAKEKHTPLTGLRGARIGLIPHQLYVASEVAQRHSPRVLLADEVGLGKTIEAGLIMHKMLLDEQIKRVLILVPEALMHQWLVEMIRRFNLRFSLFNAERINESEDENPFLQEQQIICSLDLLISQPESARLALEADWDFLVVDEAHHLHWSEEDTGLDYDLVQALADRAEGVLLLTATPEQLGRAGHFGRLHLLDPYRFPDYRQFAEEQESYESIAKLANRILAGDEIGAEEKKGLAKVLGDISGYTNDDLLSALVDRHGTGRVLFRNRRQGIAGFPERQLKVYPLPYPEQYKNLAFDDSRILTPELASSDSWPDFDPRVTWLVELLKELRDQKIVLICAHQQTVLDLKTRLLARYAIHAAVFHEGMEIVERDRAAAFFADDEEGSQLLLCSEIGSEGRNFQFAHNLVLFDLPLVPDLLEQRIGRLDRIGQKHTVKIHLPVFQGSASELFYLCYHQALNAIEKTSQTGTAVFEKYGCQLLEAIEHPSRWQEVLDRCGHYNMQLQKEVEAGRDRLLELNSHKESVSRGLLEQLTHDKSQAWVEQYIKQYWDAFGVENEPGPGQSTVLHPGQHMLSDHFPGLPSSGLTVTFERDDALVHEDREFITSEHPMVRGAMDMLLSSDRGTTAFTVVKHDELRSGTLLIEVLFTIDCPAPAELNIHRFLAAQNIRVLLDLKGNDLAGEWTNQALTGACLSHKPQVVDAIVKSQKQLIESLIEKASELAHKQSEGYLAEARKRMNSELLADLRRLQALAQVNPNIRQDELEYLQNLPDKLGFYFSRSLVKLDALRLIVAG